MPKGSFGAGGGSPPRSEDPGLRPRKIPGVWKSGVPSRSSWGRSLAVAVLVVGGCTVVRALLDPVLGSEVPLAVYTPGVLLSAWFAGGRSGIVATLLAAATGDLLFVEPRGGLAVPSAVDQIRLAVFVLSGAGFGLLTAVSRRAWDEARDRLLADERLRLIARAAQGILYDWDLRTGQVYRSENTGPLLGLPGPFPESPESWLERMHPEDRERVLPEAQAAWASAQSKFESEYRVRHEDGHWVHLWDQSYVLRDSRGRAIRVVGFSSDVTASRRAEEGLREADRRKDEFLAMLGHELRNPLAAAVGALNLVEREPQGTQGERAREVLRRQLEQLGRVVDDLLDVSRIRRGKILLRREPLDLAEVIRRAAAAVEPALHARQHALELRLPSGPLGVQGDPVRLEQVLANLLGNAVKYTEPGGHLEIRAEVRAGEISVAVRDDGIGLEPQMLPRLFEPFSQSDQSLDRSEGGLGLGLALSRGLAELHGGTLEARSEGRGKGSEFVLRLPLAELPPPAQGQASRPPAGTSRRVLLVEDNEDAAWALSELLAGWGHDVDVAENGPEGLRVALERKPEIVLLDLGLPGMDGFEVARELRRSEAGRGMCLVALSGYGQPQDQERSREAGFDRHLVKPVTVERLQEVLREGSSGTLELRS